MTFSILATTHRRAFRASITCFALTVAAGCETASQKPVLPGGQSSNRAFLQQYDQTRTRVIQETPLAILALRGKLLIARDGRITETHNIIPPDYTALKDISHVVVALWAAAWNNTAEAAAQQTAALAPHVEALSTGLADSVIPERDRSRQLRLLEAARALIRTASSPSGISSEELTKWARGVSPDILENVFEAARAELELVNMVMTRFVTSMTPGERESFIVIVGGVHQARSRNLMMQYFAALLGPRGTQDENRLIYGESIDSSEAALDLMGTHLVDRGMAYDFFGDPNRMQWDLLGAATEKIVPTLNLPSLGAE